MPGYKGQNKKHRPPQTCQCGSHCFAPATRWGIVLVSPQDARLLNDYCWSLYAPKNAPSICYAASNRHANENGPYHLHRAILLKRADHIDGNGLNNQRPNLRPSTQGQNTRNRRRNIANRSGFKGVSPTGNPTRPWRARIMVHDLEVRLGHHQTAEAAARAYDAAAIKFFGEFARLNFAPRESQNADH